jgi:hypothetical protein
VNVSNNPPVDGTMLVGTLEVAVVSAVGGAPAGGRKTLVTTAEGTMGGAEEGFAALGVCDVENTGNRGRAVEEPPGTVEGGVVAPDGAFEIGGVRELEKEVCPILGVEDIMAGGFTEAQEVEVASVAVGSEGSRDRSPV